MSIASMQGSSAALGTMIASRLAAVLLALVLMLSSAPARTAASAPLDQAAPSLATLTVLEGRVAIIPFATGTLRTASSAEWIFEGDRVLTGAPGRAILTFLDGSELELEDSTEILIQLLRQTDDGSLIIVIGQAFGTIVSRVRDTADHGRYEVVTPNTSVVVRGTVFTVEVVLDPGTRRVARESVAVQQGTVEVRTAAGLTVVQQGERLDTIPSGAIDPPAPPTTAEQPDEVADGLGGRSGNEGGDERCDRGAAHLICEGVGILDHDEESPEVDEDSGLPGLLD